MLALSVAGAATADEAPASAVSYSLTYTADLAGAVAGGAPLGGRYLDNLDAIADVDLAKVVNWQGATLHIYLLNNSGGAPNDVARTLEGVDNIEVSAPRLRLFEFWVDQRFAGGKASVRAGLYNLNSEFYSNDSAGLLLGPAFGIGSELAATGPNGPSIFPSTALAVRLNVSPWEGAHIRAAVIDAKAGVMGDPQGVDFTFDNGVLAIVEAGVEAPLKLSVGAWRYSKLQDDIRNTTPAATPARRRAQGVYMTAERRLFGAEDGRQLTAFTRIGASDAETTPFRGGWQAGLKLDRPFASRPNSAASIGVEQGLLDSEFRANLRDAGINPSGAESGIEVTYADQLTRRISVQPDLQWIHHPGGDRALPDRLMATIRFRIRLADGTIG